MSDFYSSMYNPDVLTCLANLSNDEVFTPPELQIKCWICCRKSFGMIAAQPSLIQHASPAFF